MTEPVVTGVRERAVVLGDIARSVNGSLQNTSQHLHLMKNKGILTSRREGQTIYYCIAKNELMKNCPLLLQAPQMDAF
jgi:ArsR family transcriptional regulator